MQNKAHAGYICDLVTKDAEVSGRLNRVDDSAAHLISDYLNELILDRLAAVHGISLP